jgi:hypothetical protein
MRVLFILKRREVNDPDCGVYSHSGLSSGLLNSASMVKDMLNLPRTKGNYAVDLVQVIDNNDIDREVTKFKPDVVIIEAFWVVPEKFEVLRKLHPTVKWIIRNHSNIPFLAQEGIAMDWIADCVVQNDVYVATNTKQSLADLHEVVAAQTNGLLASNKVLYFPNYYIDRTSGIHKYRPWFDSDVLHVGCFGAIRPLKNHLTQAIAALKMADYLDCPLEFHINVGRQESGGLPVLHNLRGLFENTRRAKLVEHAWMPHHEFMHLVGSMHVNMQVSLSETFNIVTADAVTMGVPVVVSSEVFWVSEQYHANPTSADSIFEKLKHVIMKEPVHAQAYKNRQGLEKYNEASFEAITKTLRQVRG